MLKIRREDNKNGKLKRNVSRGRLVAALGSGCDKDETRLYAQCEVDITSVRVLYNEKKMADDTLSIQFVRSDGARSQMQFEWYDETFNGATFPCKDGRTLVVEHNGKVYFRGGQ